MIISFAGEFIKNLIAFLFFVPLSSLAAPKVFFSWAQPYDRMCARGFDFSNLDKDADNEKLQQSWSTELKDRIPEFQQKWDELSPELFKVLLAEFKRDFSRSEYTASLSTCAVAPSMPDPFVLNVSRYLKTYMSPKPPRDLKLFIDVAFHELLHLWIAENFKQETALKIKYKNEKLGVTNHIHLFAMQSLIYEKAKRKNLWKEVHDFHIRKGGPHKRAMQILDIEGRQKILREL